MPAMKAALQHNNSRLPRIIPGIRAMRSNPQHPSQPTTQAMASDPATQVMPPPITSCVARLAIIQ